jgi:hypothetical protein
MPPLNSHHAACIAGIGLSPNVNLALRVVLVRHNSLCNLSARAQRLDHVMSPGRRGQAGVPSSAPSALLKHECNFNLSTNVFTSFRR